jgi:1,4-alpha-glucan branching enzyme
MGFTHVEFMPIMEYPYEPSWGYQVLGYFAPSSRFGTPQDFMYLMEAFHKAGVGVLLDWVPSHFPMDAHGIAEFDGTYLYEHADPRKGFHPDWKSAIYNYGRNEVRSFLISNALFWIDKFHADGLRVDAVASMLYLDYSRNEGEWIPNVFGGNQNLEAIGFLRELNEAINTQFPDVVTIAEESTAFTGVSRPVFAGGLGFNQKWMMGWMHDTLGYFKREPQYRSWHQSEITFSTVYAFSENFMLPLSHDEVVYGKGSLLTRMPGDEWQKFANLRSMFGYMFTHPGTKLLFMGGEFGQGGEWNFMGSLDWWLLDSPLHKGLQTLVKDLNNLVKSKKSLYIHQFNPEGFEWVAADDTQNCIVSYLRKGEEGDAPLLVVCHFSPTVCNNYSIGVPKSGEWQEILNTDKTLYGGSNVTNEGKLMTISEPHHGKEQSLKLTIAPLAVMVFEWKGTVKTINSF